MLLAALAAAGLTVAGCGSDDEAGEHHRRTDHQRGGRRHHDWPRRHDGRSGDVEGTDHDGGGDLDTHDSHDRPPPDPRLLPARASDDYCDAAMAINTAGTAAGDPDEDPAAFARN